MSKWIYLEKQIPEEEQDCWVCQYDNAITRAEWINYHDMFGEGFSSNEEFIKSKYVKCWMPYFTPEPPKDD